MWVGMQSKGEVYEHGEELSFSIRGDNFLSKCQVLNKDPEDHGDVYSAL
jgi:hypothetical protein